ncbi:fibronectin type III domain-containing protein [Campylobacter insulaenigrae]|uniref:Fibronectin type III domain-containing protein n=1 Tax=Campylobacter insulaenigrae TaxID=260714 RepID=A0ABY3G333_9BACT|nr:fibronectin type III domain-containing protein [Campylobacter insulaenigrae]MCR6570246.1 fibronectin type III domain-containing protein [Campylobacter insulaenigrae]MCR6572031.1 fibronectin type III domain-containing protein [Campylobacter insulaenigrae]MCR6573289.1 fibronectin type III domain-containing protein [Campylobacter insulaenigrae]MCR6576242.1 fibronectin type III domain-containing protein [Campylobacter insulaenigrae]MCR6578376.1 fibronectin type III domain-containing protein [Ca
MKKFHLTILSAALIFSACSTTSLPKTAQINEGLPKISSIKSIGDITSIAFEWEPLYDQNIAGFYIYRANSIGAPMELIAKINNKFQTHYTDTNLQPNTKYYYSMKTYNELGQISPEGVSIEAYTTRVIDPVPFAQAIVGLPNRVKIVWRPHPDFRVNSYIIERANMKDMKFKELARVKNRLSAEYIDDSLKPDESFQYRVVAQTYDGIKSAPSQVVESTTKALPPMVTNLTASKDLPKKIVLNWDKIDYADFAYYKVYSGSNTFLPLSVVAKTAENTYEDVVDGVSQKRYYKISMVDKDGLESPLMNEAVEGITLGAPLAPSIILCAVEDDGIKVEWIDNDDRAREYIVKRSGGGNSAVFKEIKSKQLKDITALPGKIYSYEVIAIDANGIESKPSNKFTAAK